MRRQPARRACARCSTWTKFRVLSATAMPPSKLPLLTLMKQARASASASCSLRRTRWTSITRASATPARGSSVALQTERDKARVLEGLLGSEAAGGLDRAGYEALMSNLTQRTFLMRNVHDDAPILFRTRWAMSYLRGPLTLSEIKRLTSGSAPASSGAAAHAGMTAVTGSEAGASPVTVTAASARESTQATGAPRLPPAVPPCSAAWRNRTFHGSRNRGPTRHDIQLTWVPACVRTNVDCESRPGRLADHVLPGPDPIRTARTGRRPRLSVNRVRASKASPPRERPSATLRPRCSPHAINKRWTKTLEDPRLSRRHARAAVVPVAEIDWRTRNDRG